MLADAVVDLFGLLEVFPVGKFVDVGKVLVRYITVTRLQLFTDAERRLFVHRLKHQEDQLFAMLGVWISLQCSLCCHDARTVVIAQIQAEVVVELGRPLFLVCQLVLQTEQHILGFFGIFAIGEKVEIRL